MNKQQLTDKLNECFPLMRKNDMQLLLTSGFAMGAGEIAYKSDCGTYSVSQTALNAMTDSETREDSLAWTEKCPISSQHDMQNPAQRGAFYSATTQ